MRRRAVVGALGLVFAGAASAAVSVTVLRFSTVVRDSKPVGSDEPSWVPAQKFGEVHAGIVPDASTMTDWYYAFPTADQRRFDAVNWNAHFVFAAVLKQRTSGYGITIKRVSLQRVSRTIRQLCVLASIEKPRPGEAVISRPYYSDHAVRMSNARFRLDQFHFTIPTRFVVRATSGQLLAVSRNGGSLGNSFVSSKPKRCTADLRASVEGSSR